MRARFVSALGNSIKREFVSSDHDGPSLPSTRPMANSISDAESDGFGAFDLSEFTPDDFAAIDTHVACRFTQQKQRGDHKDGSCTTNIGAATMAEVTTTLIPVPELEGASGLVPISGPEPGDDDGKTTPTNASIAGVEESFEFDASLNLSSLTEEDFLAIDSAVGLQLHAKDSCYASPAVVANAQPGSSRENAVDEAPTVAEVDAPPMEVESAVAPEVPLPIPKPPIVKKAIVRKAWEDRSLMERFRTSGVLSVSDLIGPSWCEFQFDYGLRQKRSRPVHQRPKTFRSSTGKEIKVEVKVAEKNDVRTKQGQAVHKEIEREIRGEEIWIDIRSDEERWGLKLLNMIVCYKLLLTEGMTREMPVFGIVNGAIVTGIIDEIVKQELPKPPPVVSPKRRNPHPSPRKPKKRAKRTPSPAADHIDIEDYFVPSPRKMRSKSKTSNTLPQHTSESLPTRASSPPQPPPPPPPPRYTLHISDTKTRVTDTMPPDQDTYCTRLQVMMYRRLLAGLTFVPGPKDSEDAKFHFDTVWEKLRLDPTAEFSTGFLVQAGLLEHNEGFEMTNLEGLVKSWESLMRSARLGEEEGAEGGVGCVDEKLELVYRLQPERMKGKGRARASAGSGMALWRAAKERRRKEKEGVGEGSSTREARDVAIAIRNSLLESLGKVSAGDSVGTPVPSGSGTAEGKQDEVIDVDAEVDVELQNALYQSLLPPGAAVDGEVDSNPITPGADPSSPEEIVPFPPPPEEIDIHGYKVIGRKYFAYDEALLQSHLDSVFQLWRGERKPVGVPVELARRCNTCEYRNGCEWREEKALEMSSGSASRTPESVTVT